MTSKHYGEKRVLDHGLVRLVDLMGGDLSVIRAARNSYNAAWRTGENEANDLRLMRRLYSGGKPVLPKLPAHSTPFEAVTFTWEIKAPIFVFRQWHRHRTWSYNEVSARYTELPEEIYIPDPSQIGVQSTANKQGREGERSAIDAAYENTMYALACGNSFDAYKDLLKRGWPRELARGVLPVATYSSMFATVNLLNFLKFLDLRLDSHAQYEIRVYAEAMFELAYDIVPATLDLFREAHA